MFGVEIEKRCLRELKKQDKGFVKQAFGLVSGTIAKDPYVGKPLKGRYKGLFSYRFGDYRIVYEIDGSKIKIMILRIAHRKNVYDGL
jgi:mRNA interferase RelE/StbE